MRDALRFGGTHIGGGVFAEDEALFHRILGGSLDRRDVALAIGIEWDSASACAATDRSQSMVELPALKIRRP